MYPIFSNANYALYYNKTKFCNRIDILLINSINLMACNKTSNRIPHSESPLRFRHITIWKAMQVLIFFNITTWKMILT